MTVSLFRLLIEVTSVGTYVRLPGLGAAYISFLWAPGPSLSAFSSWRTLRQSGEV